MALPSKKSRCGRVTMNEQLIMNSLMKDGLGGKIVKKFVTLRTKTYSYLIDDDSEDKKAKDIKKVCHKRKRKFEDYKNCLQAAELKNKISHLEKNKINVKSLKEDHKEFTKNNKIISKTQKKYA